MSAAGRRPNTELRHVASRRDISRNRYPHRLFDDLPGLPRPRRTSRLAEDVVEGVEAAGELVDRHQPDDGGVVEGLAVERGRDVEPYHDPKDDRSCQRPPASSQPTQCRLRLVERTVGLRVTQSINVSVAELSRLGPRVGGSAATFYAGTRVANRCYVGTRVATRPRPFDRLTSEHAPPRAAALPQATRAFRFVPGATTGRAEGAGAPAGSTRRARPDTGRGTFPAEGRDVPSA
jgi:hypothetical protein